MIMNNLSKFCAGKFSEGDVRCNGSIFYNYEKFRRTETAHRASSFQSLLQFQHQQAAWLVSLGLNPTGRCSILSLLFTYDSVMIVLCVCLGK